MDCSLGGAGGRGSDSEKGGGRGRARGVWDLRARTLPSEPMSAAALCWAALALCVGPDPSASPPGAGSRLPLPSDDSQASSCSSASSEPPSGRGLLWTAARVQSRLGPGYGSSGCGLPVLKIRCKCAAGGCRAAAAKSCAENPGLGSRSTDQRDGHADLTHSLGQPSPAQP